MKCRHCAADLEVTMLDLGSAPPSNAYLTRETLRTPERWFPLRVLVCVNCWLVQTEDFARSDELFDAQYAYFSSFSATWLAHAEHYVDKMVALLDLNETSHVVEIGANDGYLLQYVKAHGIPCTGVEPTTSTAAAARAKGIPIIEEFFSLRLARDLVSQGTQADLITANNVLAHVPDINDFVAGIAVLLAPRGVATFEFPHLLRLIAGNQFDTIYHEHYSYLSLTVVARIFASGGLAVFDVEEHPTHGGSLRVLAQRSETGRREPSPTVSQMVERERLAGVNSVAYYTDCQVKADKLKNEFLAFLLRVNRERRSVAAYGAAAKGNTLMNYAGVRPDLIPYVVDRNPAKQGKFMPGSRIPIVPESRLRASQPEYVVILPWNLREELTRQLEYIKAWGGKFVTAVPQLEVGQ